MVPTLRKARSTHAAGNAAAEVAVDIVVKTVAGAATETGEGWRQRL